jgi:hypothetical protein
MAHQRFVHRPLTGRHARQTALEVYGKRLADGRVERVEVHEEGLAETATPLPGLRTNEPRKGVYVRGEYFTSYALAQWNRHEDVEVRVLPANPDVAFVFDSAGTFLATVWHPDHLPAEDAHAIVQLRQDRENWAEGMHRRRAAARATTAGVPARDAGNATVVPATPTTTPPPAAPVDPTSLAMAPELQTLLTSPALLHAVRSLSDDQLAELRAAAAAAADAEPPVDADEAPAEAANVAEHYVATPPAPGVSGLLDRLAQTHRDEDS